jgi:hypothetical protein
MKMPERKNGSRIAPLKLIAHEAREQVRERRGINSTRQRFVASSVIALRELKAQGDPVILGLTTEAAARVPEAIAVEVSPGAGVVSEEEAAADAKGT